MENVILQKRSTAAGAIPAVAQLQQGEIAVNVVDGRVFIKSTANTVENLMSYTIADGGEVTAILNANVLATHAGDQITTHDSNYIEIV